MVLWEPAAEIGPIDQPTVLPGPGQGGGGWKWDENDPAEMYLPFLLPGPFTTELGISALATNRSCLEVIHLATVRAEPLQYEGSLKTHFSPLHYIYG